MEKSWTDEQRQVIDLRKRSILVSAAAGSGKTAVLVERIIQKITDEKNLLDIDQLLVVTFTKAAASEMRERVMAAVEKKLEKEPENLHLQKQKMLLPSAMITTIDSFCNSILREHFDVIGLDPGFRVGDPQEMVLMKQDTAKQLLEDFYEKKDPEFIEFIENYSNGKLDGGITERILKLYDFSQSYPWPQEWLDHVLDNHLGSDGYKEENSPVIKLIVDECKNLIEEARMLAESALELAAEPGAPEHYVPVLESDLEQVEALCECRTYSELKVLLDQISWKRLPVKKMPDLDEEQVNRVKNLRKEVKDGITFIKNNYFEEDMEVMLANEKKIYPRLCMLVRLTEEFYKRFQAEKQSKNLIDFNDLEHFALDILLGDDHVPTDHAKRYREQFEEIMCDEYQDSNQVQEALLLSISKEEDGKPNLFMVGDVKQSIYRFRMAEPGIFLRKYQTYSKEESLHQKIDLHKNFRSRPSVLNSINKIFEILMTKEICGMSYDADAALYPGLNYPETNDMTAEGSEWILVEHDNNPEVSKIEMEAMAVGKRIKELMDPGENMHVMDPDSGEYRPIEYGDIVILLRTIRNWSEDYVRVLKDMDIPAIGETSSGFFDTLEVQGVLNMLRILDNPLQDIPLAAVLRSPMGNFTNQEMAKLRLEDRNTYLYNNMKSYMEDGEDPVLIERLTDFMEKYDRLRQLKIHITIEELIYEIYHTFHYVMQMLAMPGGEVRYANLERLIEYARAFQNTSYQGLFNFIRYVDQLKEAKEDMGEAVVPGDAKKAVRIMSIHKSKGLEYPICFISGLGRNMNFMDEHSRVIIHADYGLASDGVDLEHRTKIHSLTKKVYARKLLQEQMGEEIRILYVAMTRAREKMILVGTLDHVDKYLERWSMEAEFGNAGSYSQIIGAKTFMDWIGPILCSDHQYGQSKGYKYIPVLPSELAGEEIRSEITSDEQKTNLEQYEQVGESNHPLYSEIENDFKWTYSNEIMTKIHGKMTVSELKKMAGETMPGDVLIPEVKEKTDIDPDELERTERARQKGMAVHKIFEILPFDRIGSREDIQEFIHQCVIKERIPDEWEALVPVDHVYAFYASPLGQRMKQALKEGRLYRERPFVMGIPVSEVYPELHEKDSILIQGVIDAFFEEENGIVLIDYKTDRVPQGSYGANILKKRYIKQMDYYQRAIEQITGKKVKDRILYSVIMNKEIHC